MNYTYLLRKAAVLNQGWSYNIKTRDLIPSLTDFFISQGVAYDFGVDAYVASKKKLSSQQKMPKSHNKIWGKEIL